MLREKVEKRQNTIGTIVNFSDVSVARIAALAGYDFIWIDLEHGYASLESVMGMVFAVKASGCAVVVRVPQGDLTVTKKIMEMGVDGIIFPMIRSAKEAEEQVSWTLYPPYGTRGFGPMNAVGYGFEDGNAYVKNAPKNVCRFIQIEHVDAVEDLEKIVQNPYIDGYIFGPNDLSGSLGQVGQVFDEPTTRLIKRSVEVLKKHGKYVGLATGDTSEKTLAYWRDMGVQMMTAGCDFAVFQKAMKENKETLEKLFK